MMMMKMTTGNQEVRYGERVLWPSTIRRYGDVFLFSDVRYNYFLAFLTTSFVKQYIFGEVVI